MGGRGSALKVLALMATLFAVFTLRQHFVGPPAIDPDHRFNTSAAFERLERILGDETPHPVDSDANDAVRERLVGEITALGFTPIIRDQFHCSDGWRGLTCARVQNVMFWVGPPTTEPKSAVMIASHYDSVSAGPGASDDGIGIAASLEIARILKADGPKKPVLVLITDGEEIGLVGARAFVETDPFAAAIESVISLEARGVRGPVAMFETSQPNGRDIQILRADVKHPVASSLAADVYAAMPNGTDVTEYLALDIDVGNYAIGHGSRFYHTPGDNLANLDQRSLFHMGANALAGVEAFMNSAPQTGERKRIYMDVFGAFVISLPQGVSLPVGIIAALLSLLALIRSPKRSRFKAALFPPLALVFGVGFAVALSMGIAAIRPEQFFAAAHPWALRGMQNGAALLGASLVAWPLLRGTARPALMASAWLWLSVILLGSLVMPGAAILTVPTLMVAITALIAQLMGRARTAAILSTLAAVFFVAIGIQTSALGETMLFLEASAPFTAFVVLGFVLLMPMMINEDSTDSPAFAIPIFASLLITLSFALAALRVPAYSVDAPRGLSVTHIDNGRVPSFRVRGSDPVPPAMQSVAAYKAQVTGDQHAPAPAISDLSVSAIHSLSAQKIALSVTADQADMVVVSLTELPKSKREISVNTAPPVMTDRSYINCYGRACRQLGIDVSDPGAPKNSAGIDIYSYVNGMGAAGQAMIAARPDWAVAYQWGDRRRVQTRVILGENALQSPIDNPPDTR